MKSAQQILNRGQSAALIILLRNPILVNVDVLSQLMPKLCCVIAGFSQAQRIEFAWTLQESLLRTESEAQALAHLFRQIVTLFTRFITMKVLSIGQDEGLYQDEALVWAIQSLAILCSFFFTKKNILIKQNIIAAINDASSFIPYYEFYNEAVETCMDLKEDYPRLKAKEG